MKLIKFLQMGTKMLTWVQFPEDLNQKIYKIFFEIDWFYEYLYKEIITPAKNDRLNSSFSNLFDILYDACTIYKFINEDISYVEKIIQNLNQKEINTPELEKTFVLLEDVINDLNITYLNIFILLSNDAFTFKPVDNLPAGEMIQQLDQAKERLVPIIQQAVLERSHFDKYLVELNFLYEKSNTQ